MTSTKLINRLTKITLAAALILLAPAGCATDSKMSDHQSPTHSDSPWAGLNAAVAVIHPTTGNTAAGWVRFEQTIAGLKITAVITGLAPNSIHGFHIHQFGDCTSPDGKSAGGHYNPANTPHALPETAEHHAGDLGNLLADDQGVATYVQNLPNLTIAGGVNPIIGRGVIVHALPDDGGQPTGNAGARIACGVIGIAK